MELVELVEVADVVEVAMVAVAVPEGSGPVFFDTRRRCVRGRGGEGVVLIAEARRECLR